MSLLEGIILGIIQGFSEFLPVSSSGHLVMLEQIFGINEGSLTFGIAVHIATLVAVIIFFWKDIIEIIKKPFSKLPLLIVVGTLPTIAISLLLRPVFESSYENGATLGIGFIFTGLVLILFDKERKNTKNLEKTSWLDAIFIGIGQGIAIFPAVSRSGLTIASSLARGMKREFAVRFSFLMSIPAILGAFTLDAVGIAKNGGETILNIGILPILAGMIAAGVCGYFAIRFMVKLVTKGGLKKFSYYVIPLGMLILIDQLFFGIVFNKII